jgi:hypothetical protein
LILPVAFLDGSPDQRRWVREIAPKWTDRGGAEGIYFDFKHNRPDAAIRIRFNTKDNWSKIGTDALDVSEYTEPTMKLASVTLNQTKELVQFYILHEFGHALGLLHEHKHPGTTFKWNEKVVYPFYEQRGWTKQQIAEQIINRYESYLYECKGATEYDVGSVMQYPVPEGHANIVLGYNPILTAGDRRCVAELYKPQT